MIWHQKATVYLPKRLLDMDLSRAENAVARKMVGIVRPYVPRRTGALAGSARVRDKLITYSGTAPKILYRGKRLDKKLHMQTKGTQSHWFYGAKKDNLHLIQRYAVEEIKRELRLK